LPESKALKIQWKLILSTGCEEIGLLGTAGWIRNGVNDDADSWLK
jgi:hypothetical protein